MALPSNLSAGLAVFNTTAAAVVSVLSRSHVTTVSKNSGWLGPHASGGGARWNYIWFGDRVALLAPCREGRYKFQWLQTLNHCCLH